MLCRCFCAQTGGRKQEVIRWSIQWMKNSFIWSRECWSRQAELLCFYNFSRKLFLQSYLKKLKSLVIAMVVQLVFVLIYIYIFWGGEGVKRYFYFLKICLEQTALLSVQFFYIKMLPYFFLLFLKNLDIISQPLDFLLKMLGFLLLLLLFSFSFVGFLVFWELLSLRHILWVSAFLEFFSASSYT